MPKRPRFQPEMNYSSEYSVRLNYKHNQKSGSLQWGWIWRVVCLKVKLFTNGRVLTLLLGQRTVQSSDTRKLPSTCDWGQRRVTEVVLGDRTHQLPDVKTPDLTHLSQGLVGTLWIQCNLSAYVQECPWGGMRIEKERERRMDGYKRRWSWRSCVNIINIVSTLSAPCTVHCTVCPDDLRNIV